MNDEFTITAEKKLDRIQSLLKNYNHCWAVEVTKQLIEEIEKQNLSISEKLHYYNKLIIHWEIYLTNAMSDFFERWPFIYPAYNELFHILSITKNYSQILDNGTQLIRNLIRVKFASNEQIATLLDALGIIAYQEKDLRSTIHFVYLTLYFREKGLTIQSFEKSFIILDSILQKLPPQQRSLLMYAILENTHHNFFDPTSSTESNGETESSSTPLQVNFEHFIEVINRNSQNFSAGTLKDSIATVKRNFGKFYNTPPNMEEIQTAIQSLVMINEHPWALILIMYQAEMMWNQNQQKETIPFINDFIELCLKYGIYSAAFNAFQYLHKLTRNSSGEFQPFTAQTWVTAVKKFRPLEDESFFVRSLQYLEESFSIPEDLSTFQDYSFLRNETFSLKRGLISPTEEDFWWAMLHRSIFEEGFEDIATLSAKKLKIFNHPAVGQLILNKVPETTNLLQEDLQTTSDVEVGGMLPKQINITLRMPRQSEMILQTRFVFDSEYTEDKSLQLNEMWVDPNIIRLYHNLTQINDSISDPDEFISMPRFGRLMYLLLPHEIRKLNYQLKLRGQNPTLSIIADDLNLPFELIYDQKSPFSIKYGIGYQFKKPKLTNKSTKRPGFLEKSPLAQSKYNLILVGDLNSDTPRYWNEEHQSNLPLFSFSQLSDIGGIITEKLATLNYSIGQLQNITSSEGSRENLESLITSGQNHLLIFVSNLFYLDESPLDSYFITSDNLILSFRDIDEMLSFTRNHNKIQKIPFIRPLILFTGRVLDRQYQEINHTFDLFAKITSCFEPKHILGIIARISTTWNTYIGTLITTLLERLLLGETIGSAIVTANRNQFMNLRSLRDDPDKADLLHQLEETHLIFYGDPTIGFDS